MPSLADWSWGPELQQLSSACCSIGSCSMTSFDAITRLDTPFSCNRSCRRRGQLAPDSLVEETGFEPLVPLNLRRRRFSEHLGVPRAAQRRKTDPRSTVCARCFSRLASRCGAAATSLFSPRAHRRWPGGVEGGPAVRIRFPPGESHANHRFLSSGAGALPSKNRG
jgi:hypothetical protein